MNGEMLANQTVYVGFCDLYIVMFSCIMTVIVALAQKSVRAPDFLSLLHDHFAIFRATTKKKNLTLQERVAVLALIIRNLTKE